MSREVMVWISLFLLLASGCLAQTGAPEAPFEPEATPEMAHEFTLESLGGDSVTLSDLRGQWVLVNFWATWCKPCVEEMPYLQKLAQERDLVVLGVNFNEPAGTAAQFVAEHQLSFPILLKPDDITLLVYQVRGLPRTFVIAPDGTIALRIAGALNQEELDAWLDEHLPQLVTER